MLGIGTGRGGGPKPARRECLDRDGGSSAMVTPLVRALGENEASDYRWIHD